MAATTAWEGWFGKKGKVQEVLLQVWVLFACAWLQTCPPPTPREGGCR
jgi:hypothetical protein